MLPGSSLHFMRVKFILSLVLLVLAYAADGYGQESKPVKSEVSALAVGPYGKWVATAANEPIKGSEETCVVRLWNVKEKEQQYAYPVKCQSISVMTFSKYGDTAIAVDDAGKVHYFRTKEYSTSSDLQVSKDTQFIRQDPGDGELLTVDKTHLHLYERGKEISTAPSPLKSIVDYQFLRGGTHIAIGGGLETRLLHPVTFRTMNKYGPHHQAVETFDFNFSSQGLLLVTGHKDGMLEYSHAGKRITRGAFKAHAKPVSHVHFYDAGKRVVSAGDDGFVRFWDWENGKSQGEVNVGKKPMRFTTSAFTGLTLATLVDDKVHAFSIDAQKPNQISQEWVFEPIGQPIKTDAISVAELKDPNKLGNWAKIRGDWSVKNGHIFGAGNSLMFLHQRLPQDLTMKFKLQVHGETNPRVRFDGFHFGYEGRNKQFFLHGPKATGKKFPFEFDKEYKIEVRIKGESATLLIDGKQIAQSKPKLNSKRRIGIEGGGKQSMGASEFYDLEFTFPEE